MSDDSTGGTQGRWDHLLREIPNRPTRSTSIEKVEQTLIVEAAAEPEENVYSVSDLNKAVKNQLEGKFTQIWVQGEISNFKAHTSGHHYFSLKDSKAQINAVMFKGFNQKLKFKPESGMEVIVRGKITVYEPRGNYQIFCEHMEPVGAGALQKAFEQLKAKLEKEGLFASDRKKPLPRFPKNVGVVTSPTGAAIQDILNVLGRRSKRVQVTVIPARVQGQGAAAEIVRGIELAQKLSKFDVLIVGRGGGSLEDLWCFNEEIVARAIADCSIPIIAAVGHEIDFTIADFVADYRAPTPSAAAEVVAKSEEELAERLKFFSKSLRLVMYQKISHLRQSVQHSHTRLIDPRKIVENAMLRLDDWSQRLQNSILRLIRTKRLEVKGSTQGLVSPQSVLNSYQQRRVNLEKNLIAIQKNKLIHFGSRFQRLQSLLDSLSPLRVVDRGYAIVREKDKLVADVRSLKNENIQIELRDGYIDAKVLKVTKKEKP